MLSSSHSKPKLDLQLVAHASTSSPRLPGGQRVRPNEFYRIVKNKVFDLRCFCGDTVSVFPFPKQDSLIKGHHVAMCKKKKGCKYFGTSLLLFFHLISNIWCLVDLTAAYNDALYFPLGQSSFNPVPPFHTPNIATSSSHTLEKSLPNRKPAKALPLARQNVAGLKSIRGESFSSRHCLLATAHALTSSRC